MPAETECEGVKATSRQCARAGKIAVGSGAVTFFLLAAVCSAAETEKATPIWTREFKHGVVDMALSPDGGCVAVIPQSPPDAQGRGRSGGTAVVVIDRTGQVLWEQDLAKINPWLLAKKVVVAPGCSWVLLGGPPSYRCVWAVGRHGARWHLETDGTPEAIAISHKGDLVAIGTAAGNTYLVSSAGRMLSRSSKQYAIIEEMKFSHSDEFFAITEGSTLGLFDRSGKALWRHGEWFGQMTMSNDAERFLVISAPGHGPAVTDISLLDREGTTLWKGSYCEGDGAVAMDGQFTFVMGRPLEDCWCADPPDDLGLWVLDESGAISGEHPRGPARWIRPIGRDRDCIILERQLENPQRADLECRDERFEVRWVLKNVNPWPLTAMHDGVRWFITGDVRAYAFPPR